MYKQMEEIYNPKIKYEKIRKQWDEKNKKWYFPIVDIIAVTHSSSNPRNYWKVFKNRLNKAQNKLVTQCNQLKIRARDGKFYLTDVADVDTVIEILKLLSPKNLLPFKAWAMSLDRPKNTQVPSLPSRSKMTAEISFRKKDLSYPQVKYTLANLMNRKSKMSDVKIEPVILNNKQETNKKIPKRIRMGTI